MTKILVPFVFYKFEAGQKIPHIGYYEDELSNVYNVCTKCLSIHDRKSAFCQLCSDEHKAKDEESFKARLVKNQEAIEKKQKQIREELADDEAQLSRWGIVTAIRHGDTDATEKNSGEVREEGEDVVQDNVPTKRTKGRSRAKARVV